jgi:PAS domain S-box-containing protein
MWPIVAWDGGFMGTLIQVTETAPAHQQAAAMNQALLLGSVHQHELTEEADKLNAQLQTEILERNRAEEDLRKIAGRLRFMAESMPQKIFTAKPNGDIDYFNEQWMEFTGLSFEQIKDWGWTRFIHPDDVEETVRIWRQSVETGEPFQFVDRFRRHDGVYRWHLERAQAMRDDNGEISMWIGSSTDISEQKQMEEDLQQVNESLRRANSDLEQFAYSASHDLQEPIRNISIFSEIIDKGYSQLLDARGKESLGFVMAGARRMDLLVKDLLAYIHAARAPEINEEETDATAALAGVLSDLSALIHETGAQVTHDILPKLQMREIELQQLFQNLIGNAIKYRRDETPVRIHITAQRDGKMWQLSVRDNGLGIPPDCKETVFGIFKRLHGGRKYPGTGIGLAICQKIVERYGGRIWVESADGEGSTFSFTVPVLDE